MHMRARLILLAVLAAGSAPALADATDFTLVNGTGTGLADVAIRRAGTTDWKTLGAAPPAGARSPVQFKDPDCAFDIRASVGGAGPVTWAGVNLCDVKSVTLKRDASAGPWVDYDE
ncbi:hypothetical protein H9L13_05090 [Sphingomonas lutea]|uniref:Uncharacterized protein n=1 Tax=Sphingomonas lutea TaxID=1045317 RepID=A0A7G9SK75_9SPHN|nr:hypothetical protein [Sphingomonas lutea]QNN68250.1 hypothetical protein H9L13_05090 [Sphingomonas lutea]